jgi:class 3 adenylate cyclase
MIAKLRTLSRAGERHVCQRPSAFEFRVGLNVGDTVVDDGDICGDRVNVAARLDALARPGGICVSARVQETLPVSSTSPSRIWVSRT